MWPFQKNRKQRDLLKKLPFKSGGDFLEFQCKYGDVEITPNKGIVALVLDSKKEFGAEKPVNVDQDGIQTVTLKVASSDGGFIVFAQTPTRRGDLLSPNDVVLWVPMSHSEEFVPEGMDKRFGWVGHVVAKVEPEIDLENSKIPVLCRYD